MSTPELLLRACGGDKQACEQMVEENAGLIWSVARRFFGRGVDPDDLYQLGCLGFLKALEGFDPDYGTQFSTYAVPKISGEIRRFLRDDGTVKVSRSVKERAAAIKAARQRLSARLDREPTLSELAGETGFTIQEIAVAESATAATESIHKQLWEDGGTLEDTLSSPGVEDGILETMALHTALSSLPQRERLVIDLRFYRGLTQDKTARILGVSQVQVSRIEKKALAALRQYFQTADYG